MIESVGKWTGHELHSADEFHDLGDSILLPGLINAHCHLDYSAMAGQLEPTSSFVDWVGLITASKGGWLYSDFAASWISGASMLLKNGTTTVADIEMAPELLPEIWAATPMRIISFLEMTGVRSKRPPAEILGDALHIIESAKHPRNRIALSPHAPYSTTPELLQLCADAARKHHLPVTTHVSESAEEFEMYQHGRGKMYDWIARSGRTMNDCGIGTPVEHLHRQGLLGPNFLAVHANYLTNWDIKLLATNQVSVVHCPGSHNYFRHQPFPYEALSAAGVNICLGTDSLASSLKVNRKIPELNLFEEMRHFAKHHPTLAPEIMLRMATLNGARALGLSRLAGEIIPDAKADLISIPYSGSIEQSQDAVLNHPGPVSWSMIQGQGVSLTHTPSIPPQSVGSSETFA